MPDLFTVSVYGPSWGPKRPSIQATVPLTRAREVAVKALEEGYIDFMLTRKEGVHFGTLTGDQDDLEALRDIALKDLYAKFLPLDAYDGD